MIIEMHSKELARQELLTPYIQPFHDDRYHEPDREWEGEEDYQLDEVKRIRRRYADLVELQHAKAVYETYMANLMDRYGGDLGYQIAQFLGHVYEYIPPEPKMKPSKKNRLLEKHGIIVSNTVKIDPEFIETFKNQTSDYTEKDLTRGKKMNKRTVRKFKEAMDRRMIFDYRSTKSIDYLESYFRSRNEKAALKEEEWEKPTVTDYFNGNYVVDDPKEKDPDEVIYYKGNWLSRKDIEVFETFEKLGELGWDDYKLIQQTKHSMAFRKNRLTKLYKKERKRKKKEEKYKKKKKNTPMDDFLKTIGLSEGYESMAELEDDMETMYAQQVFESSGEEDE